MFYTGLVGVKGHTKLCAVEGKQRVNIHCVGLDSGSPHSAFPELTYTLLFKIWEYDYVYK